MSIYGLLIEFQASKYLRHYHYRNGPVPGIHAWRGGRSYFRCPKTKAEISSNTHFTNDEAREFKVKVRSKRSRKNLPTNYDDINYSRKGNGWKNQRKTQYKNKFMVP